MQYSEGVLYSYRRGLRSCLSLQGGKFEGQEREVSNGYGSHAFLFYVATTNSKTKHSCRRSQDWKTEFNISGYYENY